jgi:Fe-S-cluster formation regulator IscX/YfhJ
MNEIIAKLRAFDDDMRKALNSPRTTAARDLYELVHQWQDLNLLANMIQIDAIDKVDTLAVHQDLRKDICSPQEYYADRNFRFSREVFKAIHSNPVTHELATTEQDGIRTTAFKMWIVPFMERKT